MIDRERIIGMPLQYLLKLLHRDAVFQVVKVVKGGGIQRVRRPGYPQGRDVGRRLRHGLAETHAGVHCGDAKDTQEN